MAINLNTVLDQDAGRALVERILVKEFLARVKFDGPLANNKAYVLSKALPGRQGQYMEFTRKNHIRRPETEADSTLGTDPAGGVSLGVNKVLLPIEYHRDYGKIQTNAQDTSWINLEDWVKEDAMIAWKRRMHELVQNAFVMGRAAPGVYDSSGNITTAFDATAAASPTLYGVSFSFDAAPHYYAGGATDFGTLTAAHTMTWADIRSARVRLGNSKAPKISGNKGPGYMCVLSDAQWNDLLLDDDGGRLTAAMAGGLNAAIEGLVNHQIFKYAGVYFVIDDQPFTEAISGTENARVNWGGIHSALMFGNEAYGFLPMSGKNAMRPGFKVQDITLTGYEFTVGWRVPWNCRIVNPDWALVIKSGVSEAEPNNYDAASNTQTHGFDVS